MTVSLYNSSFSKLSEFMLSVPRVHGHNKKSELMLMRRDTASV